MIKAACNDAVVAESDDTVLLDGNHYFPRDAVNSAFLRDSEHTTVCGWKGTASYFSL